MSIPVGKAREGCRGRTFGLHFTADSGLLESLLLLLNRRCLFNGLVMPAPASEEHGG